MGHRGKLLQNRELGVMNPEVIAKQWYFAICTNTGCLGKKNNVTIQTLLPSRRRTPCWSGSQVVWFLGVPTSPSLLWAEVLAERCNPGREGQSQEPGTNLCNSWAVSASPARRGEQSSSPGQHQVLNAVINEASRRGFNDSWHSSWMHKSFLQDVNTRCIWATWLSLREPLQPRVAQGHHSQDLQLQKRWLTLEQKSFQWKTGQVSVVPYRKAWLPICHQIFLSNLVPKLDFLLLYFSVVMREK